ncbi:hypothetical protein ACFY9F_22490 [Streptomyces sp. NPDC012421]|uniref:hypothetical protein n=1 Tax=Streptomyces sp. NPDC012421 TaxID=3364832 RepID=UPI0036ECBB85
MVDHYPYRVVSGAECVTLVWRPGVGDALDEFVVGERGGLLDFADRDSLRGYGDRKGWSLGWEDEGAIDLDVVRGWVERPGSEHGAASVGLLLDAWHFVEDLARGMGEGPLRFARGPVADRAWEKAYGEEPWTREEAAAVRALLREGLALWERAMAVPRSPAP